MLGEAARANATDVVLKCVKYWEASECAGMYPGCQTKYDEKVFSKISGKMLSCEDAINSKEFKRGIRRNYFSDPRTAAYKFVCYRVQDDQKLGHP